MCGTESRGLLAAAVLPLGGTLRTMVNRGHFGR